MSKSIRMPKYFSKLAVPRKGLSLFLWINLIVILNVTIWGLALAFLKVKKPAYTSEFAITLPETGSATNVFVPNIAQASYQNASPYANSSIQDPREVYKAIGDSDPVIKAAADGLNLPVEGFGKPRIKTVLNTTLMIFEMKGGSPEEARNKNLALYKAFQTRLNELRAEEIAQKEYILQDAFSASQKKLKAAEKRLSEYKAISGLSSSEQLTNLSVNIEQLRRQQAETKAQQQQANARINQLSTNLSLSSQQAADAFALQTDTLFQKYLQDLSDANAALVALNAKFLPSHPEVVYQRAKRDDAQAALLKRGQLLLGRPMTPTTVNQLNLSNSSSRATLSQELVKTQSDRQGLEAQARSLEQQILLLEQRHKTLAQKEITLQQLDRDVKIAEAVFSSTLARLDLGKSNGFASYPPVFLIAEPSLPNAPSSPKKTLILLGTAGASFFLTSGIVSFLLFRKRLLKKFASKKDVAFKDSHGENHYSKNGFVPNLNVHETIAVGERTTER